MKKRILSILVILIVLITSLIFTLSQNHNSNPFVGRWEAVEYVNGEKKVWAEEMLFNENLDMYIHSNVVGEKRGYPIEKCTYTVDTNKKELNITTSFGMEERYKYKLITDDKFVLDKEFVNISFVRIDKPKGDYLIKNN